MRRSPVLILLASTALAVTACGGGGDSTPAAPRLTIEHDAPGQNYPLADGPVVIPGAQKGGMVTVLTQTGLTTSIDPADAYYLDTISIDSNLITRSLTQYKYDPKSKSMVLIPDLAMNLGQHNDDYTKWTFEIRKDVKFEDGSKVTAQNIAWGIQRCMDTATFPTGPCQYYANAYFHGGSSYKGPYTAPHQRFDAVSARGNKLTIKLDHPFPDMAYWGTFPAMGPVPLGKASDPSAYKNHPLATGPYMVKSYSPSKELVLERNPYWDPKTDPGRTQYPEGYDFKTQQQPEKTDQILLADSGGGQTTLTYDNLLAPDYQQLVAKDPDRLTLGVVPCTFYWAPDNRKITDQRVREALSWAYPYKDAILAGGDIPGVTALPGNNLMPPGIPGRKAYGVTGRAAFETDPAKARALLQAAGEVGYDIRFLFRTDDPSSVKVKDAVVKALTAAGFKATPVPTTIADYVADRGKTTSDINVRSASWCSDWPSGSTWLPTVYADTHPDTTGSLGGDYAAFHEPTVPRKIAAIDKLPLDQQPAAWNRLDREVMQRYFPLFPTYYGGEAMAHGSKIEGMADDPTTGMPTWKQVWVSP
jgi:peptide/nickel transport system substrate-binding protein